MMRPADSPKVLRVKILIAVLVLGWMAFLLFFRLGHYALWDDEAICALFGKTLFTTGDTSALLGHNIIAFNDGRELESLRQRYVPPLQFYIVAPFAGLTSRSAFAVRFPFAVCGLLTVALILWWLWDARASLGTWLLMSAGIMGNVSFVLFSRQCRYYAPMMLATVLLAYLYLERRKAVWLIALTALLLLASNYLCYLAVVVCGCVHYLVWGRRGQAFSRAHGFILAATQMIIGGGIVATYNPAGKDVWDYSSRSWLEERVQLLLWNFRDLNASEMGVGFLLVLAPFLYFLKKDRRLIETPVMIVIYILTVAFLSPQPVGQMSVAFVRYLCPLIPLCIFTAVIVIQALTSRLKWLAFPLALLVFATNIVHGGPLLRHADGTAFSRVMEKGHWRSTALDFLRELATERKGPYRMAAEWINKNVKGGESVLVVPGYAVYPLLFHAPHAVYAWQLAGNEEGRQFQALPDIHFRGRVLPDYIIAFGPSVVDAANLIGRDAPGVRYNAVEQLNVYWADLIRPELFWHSFDPVRNYDPDTESVIIYKQVSR